MIVVVAHINSCVMYLFVYSTDLAIYDDFLKIGFGLCNHRGLEFGFEIAILAGGILIYLKRNSSIARKAGIVAFGVVLILIQVWNTFAGRRPTSDRTFAITALIFYTLFAGIAFLLEKRSKLATGRVRPIVEPD